MSNTTSNPSQQQSGPSGAGAKVQGGGSGGVAPPSPGGNMLPWQEVAPWTDLQNWAYGNAGGLYNQTSGLNNAAINQQQGVIGGSLLDQNNPYLKDYYNAGASAITDQYQQATMPNILGGAAQTGNVFSQGTNQAINNADTALSKGLGNYAAGLYSPAYQQGVSLTESAAQNAPYLAQGAWNPNTQLYNMGAAGQSQAQDVLNTGYNNQYQQAMWPFTELGYLGQGLGSFGGGGTTHTTAPSSASGK